MSQLATMQPTTDRRTASEVPFASVSLGPGIQLRCYFMPSGGHRWEFVSVSKNGRSTHYDLPDLGGFYVVHADRGGWRLDTMASSIGKELKAVLHLVTVIAKEPDNYPGIDAREWVNAATVDEQGWMYIMDCLAQLQNRSIERPKLIMTEKDWVAVHRVLSAHYELRMVLTGLASLPLRGTTLQMWVPVNLVHGLQREAERRNVEPSQVLLDALALRFSNG